MAQGIQHRRLKAEDGERFSLLLNGDPAIPLFYPTVYSVEYRRSSGLAASTIWNDEEALKHLLVWASNADIDLDARFDAEIGSYARAAKRAHRLLRNAEAVKPRAVFDSAALLKVGREAFRARSQPAEPSVGTRKGEAQKQHVCHIDMHRQQVSIVRNPDAIDDDRRVEPNVKRVGRVLPMTSFLSDLLSDYVTDWRGALPGSEKTDYLFLTINGKPMSAEAVHKVFRTLRGMLTELPRNLSAHLLRHTWNDNYSITMDANRVDPVNETRTRSYLTLSGSCALRGLPPESSRLH